MHESTREAPPDGPRQEGARITDRLKQLRRRRFVGRQRKLEQLERCTEPDGPAITFLHGIGGMGKSALLEVLQERLRARGLLSVYLDARSFEPTPRGFWEALEAALRAGRPEPAEPGVEAIS